MHNPETEPTNENPEFDIDQHRKERWEQLELDLWPETNDQ